MHFGCVDLVDSTSRRVERVESFRVVTSGIWAYAITFQHVDTSVFSQTMVRWSLDASSAPATVLTARRR